MLARIGIFWGRPEGVLSTAEGPRPFQPWDPRPLHGGRDCARPAYCFCRDVRVCFGVVLHL